MKNRSSGKTVAVETELDTGKVTVGEGVSAEAPVLVAQYDENGRFIGAEFVRVELIEVEAADGTKSIEILWIDSQAGPESEAIDFEIGEGSSD